MKWLKEFLFGPSVEWTEEDEKRVAERHKQQENCTHEWTRLGSNDYPLPRVYFCCMKCDARKTILI
jgi:hypothetical protein